MPAYIVSMQNIHDPETYRKYTARTPPTLARYGGRFLARGGDVDVLEGKFDDRLVILEFPSMQAARDWMADAEYVELMKFRHAASSATVLLIDGEADTGAPDAKI